MSKKETTQKNVKLSNIATIIVLIACILILFSSTILKTLLILLGAIILISFIGMKIDKVQK